MQIILRDDLDNLGKSGEVVNVKPGYARNYLLPRGLAIKATASDVARVEHEKRVIAARATGEEDKLFGSVTARDIAEALKEKGVHVDAKKIHLEEPIKALGLAEVPLKLGRGVTATIKVWVVKKED